MATPVARAKIYTGTGDAGSSSLYNGQRLPKDNAFFHALGDVDELNSSIGLAKEFCKECDASAIVGQLEFVQSRLLDVGSAVATPAATSSESKLKRTQFDGSHSATIEEWIDQLDADLPSLTAFILPSGGKASAFLHQARSVCRRAERSVVALTLQEAFDNDVAVFLNRLSDYLFTAARWVAKKDNHAETTYKKQ